VVFQSVDRVIKEVKFISDHSRKRVFLFQDDQITLRRDRAKTLFERLMDEDLGMLWKCFVRVDLVDEELLALMRESGCVQVRFGIESGSNRVLKAIKKGFTIEEAHRAVRLAIKYMPSVHASFIWGYPFETLQECKETMKWVHRLQDEGCTVLISSCRPCPTARYTRTTEGHWISMRTSWPISIFPVGRT